MSDNNKTQTRAPKQIGDFGEGLVNYILIRKGHEVAYVDHVGADLISEKNGNRFAISVKTRVFKEGSEESKMVIVSDDNLKKLKGFANKFSLNCLFAQVICYVDLKKIYIFIMSLDDLENSTILPKIEKGYSLNFSNKNIEKLKQTKRIDFSYLENETIGNLDWDSPN